MRFKSKATPTTDATGYRKTFKYRAYPNRAQAETLSRWIEMCRELYNAMIEERRHAYQERHLHGGHPRRITYYDQQNQLPGLKKAFPEYAEIGSAALQNVAMRVHQAFERFFKGAGYPKFQGRRYYESITFPSASGWKLDGSGLHVSRCGRLKVKWHRPVEGDPKTLTIKHRNGKWFVCISCANVPAPQYPETDAAVGIDLGLEALATTSDGQRFENAKFLRQNKKRLRRVQRHLARQKRRTNRSNRSKATVRQIQRLHERVANQRRDAHHKASTALVRDYAIIVKEEISPQFMIKNRRLAFSASDVGWSQFTTFLQQKAAAAGRTVLTVNAAYTSQVCSGCGVIVPKPLSERRHTCPECGMDLHRDHNAAINILRAAIGEPTTARAEPAVTVPIGVPDDPRTPHTWAQVTLAFVGTP